MVEQETSWPKRPDGKWNQRYAGDDYLFGTAPALFVSERAHLLSPQSSVLCVADGEGRNSTYLAVQGHRVTAFDAAPNALEKAKRLAAERGVDVALHQATTETWSWTPEAYDVVAAIFIQFADPNSRAEIFARIAETLRPGGILMLHGYAPRQVEYGTGGPPFVEHMYTLELLHTFFPGWDIWHEADYDRDIQEGAGHSGLSGLIDFIAVKPT